MTIIILVIFALIAMGFIILEAMKCSRALLTIVEMCEWGASPAKIREVAAKALGID